MSPMMAELIYNVNLLLSEQLENTYQRMLLPDPAEKSGD
jgi:hypothetical protein